VFPDDSCTFLASNEDVATQPCEIARRKFDDALLLKRRDKDDIRVAEAARSRRDDQDSFRTEKRAEDIWSNGTIVRDCVHGTVVLVSHKNLAAERPEA